MSGGPNGFTVIETVIFLAVSTFLVSMSIIFLSGKQARTNFSQSMRDVQSQVQDWINDVPTGFAGESSGTSVNTVHCEIIGGANGTPRIDDTGMPSNTGGCIFLGKAIQFTDASSPPTTDQERMIYAYSVFGNRSYTPPSEDKRLTASLSEANPVAATGLGNVGNKDMTETYRLGGSTKVKSILQSSGVPGSHLAGFYLSFNKLSVKSNGSADLVAYQYRVNGNQKPANTNPPNNPISDCIGLIGTCSTTSTLSNWQICFDNDNNKDTAILTIHAVGGLAVTTNLEFKTC